MIIIIIFPVSLDRAVDDDQADGERACKQERAESWDDDDDDDTQCIAKHQKENVSSCIIIHHDEIGERDTNIFFHWNLLICLSVQRSGRAEHTKKNRNVSNYVCLWLCCLPT